MWLWPSDQTSCGTDPCRANQAAVRAATWAWLNGGGCWGAAKSRGGRPAGAAAGGGAGRGGGVAVVRDLQLAALAGVGDRVEAGQQAGPAHAVERAAAVADEVGGDVHAAGRVAGHHDAVRVAAVVGDVVADPLDGCRDVLRAGRPGVLGGEPVRHRDADPTVADRPRPDVVVHRGAGDVLVAAGEAAAVDEQDDGGLVAGRAGAGRVDVEAVAFVVAVAAVAVDLGRGVAGLLVERREQRPAALHQLRGDHRAHRGQMRDDVRREVLGHSPGAFRRGGRFGVGDRSSMTGYGLVPLGAGTHNGAAGACGRLRAATV